MSNQELRDKYISKEEEYSYIHKHDLDKLLTKLESLQAQVTSNHAEIEKLKTAKVQP